MKHFYQFVALILFGQLAVAQPNIIPNYGELDGVTSNNQFVRSARFADKIAVIVNFDDDNEADGLHILDQEGNLEAFFPLHTDSSLFSAAILMAYEDDLFLAGYQSALPVSIDSAYLRSRDFVIKRYKPDTGFEVLSETLVFMNELGYPFNGNFVSNDYDIVVYQPYTMMGAVSENQIFVVNENAIATYDENGFPVGSIGNTLLTVYDRNTGTTQRVIESLPGAFRGIADIVAFDDECIVYALKGYGENMSTVHYIDQLGSITETDIDPSIFNLFMLSQYATKIDNSTIVEAAAKIPDPTTDYNMLGTQVNLLENDRTLIAAGPFIPEGAPYGEGSLITGEDDNVFMATVSVRDEDRLDLPITLHNINTSNLEINWSFQLDRDTFGLFQSMVPTDDGGVIIFGKNEIAISVYEYHITKIGPDLTRTTQIFNSLNEWILGPNPTQGEVQIAEEAMTYHQDLQLVGFNMAGQQVIQQAVKGSSIQLNSTQEVLILQLRDKNERVLAVRKVVFQ